MLPSLSRILAEAINRKILTKNHPNSPHSPPWFPSFPPPFSAFPPWFPAFSPWFPAFPSFHHSVPRSPFRLLQIALKVINVGMYSKNFIMWLYRKHSFSLGAESFNNIFSFTLNYVYLLKRFILADEWRLISYEVFQWV